LVALVTGIAPLKAQAQGTENLAALRVQVGLLYGQGKFAAATPIAEHYVALARERHGEEHEEFATAISWLALLYGAQARYTEAGPLYRRTVSIFEKALGPDHPDVGTALNNLAGIYQNQGRYGEAEPLYRRSLAIAEKSLGPEHPDVGTPLNNLAELYRQQGRYGEAEPLYRRSLAVREKSLGRDDPLVAISLNNLALLYESQGRYGEAEPLCRRSLAIREKALGPDHLDVGTSLNNLAGLYRVQGRYAEAEPLYRRSFAIREKRLGPNHPAVGVSLNSLAELYRAQGRDAEAEQLYRRSLAITEKALGLEHPNVSLSLNGLAALYESQDRYAEAEPLYRRTIAIVGKTAPGHPDVATALNNLAVLYDRQGHNGEAERLYQRSLAIREKALGADHPSVGQSLNGLAALHTRLGRYGEAEPLYRRSLVIREKALGPDHPNVATTLNNLAVFYLAQRDWASAADYWRRSTNIAVRRAKRGADDVGQALTGKRKGEVEQQSGRFSGLVKVAHRLASQGRGDPATLLREMFQTAQWAQASEAAASLAQMAARGAKGDTALSRLVRDRQDLVGEWQRRDGARNLAVSQAPDRRDRAAEDADFARMAAIDARIAEIDRRLASDFPDYAALARPEPLSVEQVQIELRADEALILLIDTPEWQPMQEETFIWIVTKSDVRWLRSDLGTSALTRKVAALRCGLDEEEWATASKAVACGKRLAVTDQPASSAPLPFDLTIAHELYRALLGEAEDMIRGKRLLLVPSGPLTSIPFHVLVTKPANAARPTNFGGYRDVAWLGRTQALTVLPAVSSLKALRQHASRGVKPSDDYIGYGNPVLKGDGVSCRPAKVPDACPDQTRGPAASGEGRATIRGRGGRRSANLGDVFSKGGSNAAVLEHVRALCPLPDSAYEIKCVAKRFRATASQIRLDRAAHEADIKALNAGGALARYRVVHFATHGLLAGDVEVMTKRQGEPALVLTPPDTPKDRDDDGLLTASEVAELKLNADWVVLSACNTAAGDRLGAEALSGLARAFFYAGAKALLVSHWPVYSDAAVRLTTAAFAHLDRDARGRAEALQRAMMGLMEDPSQEDNAHPAVWAPFVVIGEGK
jgi:CHAT domain-containing protein/tetratricopeptide (TPR) repeat protein